MKKLAFLLITFAFILVGCVAVEPPKNIPQEACRIFSEEDIIPLTGEDYDTEAMEELGADTSGCMFVNTTDDPLFARNFNLILRTTEDEKTAKIEFDRAGGVWRNSPIAQKKLEVVEDVGQEALWVYGKQTSQFISYSGETLIILSFGHIETPETDLLENARNLAQKIFASLPQNPS